MGDVGNLDDGPTLEEQLVASGVLAAGAKPGATAAALPGDPPSNKSSLDAMPHVGDADDLDGKSLPPDASSARRFFHKPAVKRTVHVLVAIAVAAVLFVIVNVAFKERSFVTCEGPQDCRKMRRVNTIFAAVRSILNLIIGFALLFVILGQLGVDTKALLATAGLVGIIVGLGAQPAIRNFFAGLAFVAGDRFSIGDFVTLDLASAENVKGIVTDFSLQAVTLRDFSGAKYYVPNGTIQVVVNYSQNNQRAQVELQIRNDADVDTTLQEIQELTEVMATAEPLKGKVVRPPVVKGITRNGPHSYTVAVAAIAEPLTQIFVERYMRYQLLRLLQRMGVDASAITYRTDVLDGSRKATRVETSDAVPPPASALPQLAPINVDEPDDDITDVTPETERGDVTVPHGGRVARTLRHQPDAIADGSLPRRGWDASQGHVEMLPSDNLTALDEFQE